MEKEYLLMVKVRADKEKAREYGNIEIITDNAKEVGYFNVSRLIDPADLSVGLPKAGDEYFYRGTWRTANYDHTPEAGPHLIHRKPKGKWVEWSARCPLTEWTPEMRGKLADWIQEGIKIGKGE